MAAATLRGMTPITGRIFKPIVLALIGLLVFSIPMAGPAAADVDQCAPPGVDSASAVPTNLASAAKGPGEDKYTTATVAPLRTGQRRRAGPWHPGRADRRHPVRRTAEHLHQLAGSNSPGSTTSCCGPSPKSWACESISSAPSSPACSPRWHHDASTSARRRSPPPMPDGAPSASPTATTSATSRSWCRPDRRSPDSTSSPPASASASCRAPCRRRTSSTPCIWIPSSSPTTTPSTPA